MSERNLKHPQLTDRDLDFLAETAAPEVGERTRLRQVLREDEDFRNAFISDERVIRRLISEEENFLKISPHLYFEALLRKTRGDLETAGYTVERTRTLKVPVFDTGEVVELLKKDPVLLYLADMLASFTRIESYTVSYRARKGIWRKIRFNDMDIRSLMNIAGAVEQEHRLRFYKRIADICLFILGIFPDYVQGEHRYPSGQLRPQARGRPRISPEDYAAEGRRFYKLAAEHPAAGALELAETFWILHREFQKAKKPLNFIAEHYLRGLREKIFH